MGMEPDFARHQFAKLGFQYYAAGRSAFHAHLMPTAAILLHHAVEMMLKAALVRTCDLSELKEMRHRLDLLHERGVLTSAALDGSECRRAIAALERFENLRYPDDVLVNGADILWSVTSPAPTSDQSAHHPTPQYTLVLQEVDQLMSAAIRAARLNPAPFVSALSERARESLREHNTEAGFLALLSETSARH